MAAQSGRRWFLSYHTPDQALAQRLVVALRQRDPDAHIFFSSESLRAGQRWLPELSREIAEATAFLLLVGEHGLGRWQELEYCEALDRHVKEPGFPVVLVLLEGQTAPGLSFLRHFHRIVSADPASEKSIARILDATAGGSGQPSELWRHTAPYRGLAAMKESDADFFFGREREAAEVIGALATTPNKLALLLGNSGVGKSSLAQAGVLAALLRQGWGECSDDGAAWPAQFHDSRRWCYLTLRPGTEPVRALVEPFLRTWQLDATDPERAKRLSHWATDLLEGAVGLRDLLDATQARCRDELRQLEPPAFLLYVDQGEELYVRADERQRRRFSELLAEGLPDPRLRAMMSVRADFLGEVQRDEPLYAVHRQINVPPLREAALQEVVGRPAELLGARFEMEGLAAHIAGRTAEESARDAGALPLLSYLLDDMWTRMVQRGDGMLKLPAPSFDLGGVLVKRADDFLAAHPDAEDWLRRIFTLKLATVYEDGEPTRRRALRSEFSDEEWALVAELADHPNRLLVTSTTENGVAFAEVAHEAIFRRWGKLRDWISSERKFLAWKTALEAARRGWDTAPERSKRDALLMGLALDTARVWYAERARDLSDVDREFVERSVARDEQARRRERRGRRFSYAMLSAIIVGLLCWRFQDNIRASGNWALMQLPYMITNMKPLSAEEEHSLHPGDSFRECVKNCPEMVVIPAGTFWMGSDKDDDHNANEIPEHQVTIGHPFAVSRFDVTFDDWDACVSVGACPEVNDSGMGRGRKPVINVTWSEAQQYVTWLSHMTGHSYRLLTEAEWEYVARGGTGWKYPWGDDIGQGNADCDGCKSDWDGRDTSPVGSFKANKFGLYDMVGDVYQWVQDCYVGSYAEAPVDGSARTRADLARTFRRHAQTDAAAATVQEESCHRVIRGGSWDYGPRYLRCAARGSAPMVGREERIGFRVARTLSP